MAYANEVKLFGKWSYEDVEVSARDSSCHLLLFFLSFSSKSERGVSFEKRRMKNLAFFAFMFSSNLVSDALVPVYLLV